MNNSNPLTAVLPARVRQLLYAALFVVALVFSLYQAADGDWDVFAGSLVASLLGLLAASNITPETPAKPEIDYGGEV